ncbi:MAG: TlpA family protein disulfide reductase [candidate division Zixibacteria bacterium]|nr:TlpA family protein disulfide reductase [candidate division Zixibacteria bacterium]
MRTLPFLGVLIIFGCLIFGCSAEKQDAAQTNNADQETAQSEPGTNATAAVWTAADTRGVTRQGNDWVGKQPTVINFWGTWCPPCRKEIPDLVKLYAEYNPKGVEIVGFAVRDQAPSVQVFANEAGMNWVMLMGNDEVIEKYGPITGVPTTIFLDKDGREVSRFIGAQPYETFKPAFDSMLQGYSPAQSSL